jgi:hypothetical protein
MVACLAIASCVYYALELAYVMLERERRGIRLAERVEQLETQLKELMIVEPIEPGVDTRSNLHGDAGAGKSSSWWKFW